MEVETNIQEGIFCVRGGDYGGELRRVRIPRSRSLTLREDTSTLKICNYNILALGSRSQPFQGGYARGFSPARSLAVET